MSHVRDGMSGYPANVLPRQRTQVYLEQSVSRLGVESGVAGGLVPVNVQSAGHMGQQLGQLHGVPGAAAPRLLEGVGAPFVRL